MPTHVLRRSSKPQQAFPINSARSDVSENGDQAVFAKRALLTAQVNVYKVNLIVACLESAIGKGRNLDDAEFHELAASADKRINKEFVRAFITIKKFTLKKAKQELKEAKQELKEAEVKLEKATRELQELVKCGMEGDVATVLEQYKGFSLIAIDPYRACDMSRIAAFMAKETEDILRMVDIILQDSRSVVIRSSSGVGKTFATLALTHALRALKVGYFPIALYMGFNSKCPLSKEEEERLERNDEMSEKRLKLVLLRRLLLQLSYLASADVKVDDSLWDAKTGIQRMPMPPSEGVRWAKCTLHFRTETNCDDLVLMVCPLLDKISQKVGKPVVIYPIVDEGQYLDTHCPKSSGKNPGEKPGQNQGARWALRLLRTIQIAVLNDHVRRGKQSARHTALGIMTGINPAVSLVNTYGQNLSYSEPLHSMDGFKEITRGHQANRKRTNGQIARIAATFYPIARDVTNFSLYGKNTKCTFTPSGRDAAALIIASGTGKQLTREWSVDTPAIFEEGQVSRPDGKEKFTPVLGIRHVAAAADSIGALPCTPTLITDLSLHINYNGFEDACLFSLSMLLVLRNYSLPANERMNKRKLSTDVYKWLNAGTPLNVIETVIRPENAKDVYFPSSSNKKSHAAAFSVVDGSSAKLNTLFDLSSLDLVGKTTLMACGGDAPVDFIIVTLLRLADAPLNVRAKLQIRLCDAKLVTSKEKSSISGISKMPGRFELVKKFLKHHLSTEYEVKFLPHAIITTSTDTKMPKGMIAISPATCHFPPITDWLFAWAPQANKR